MNSDLSDLRVGHNAFFSTVPTGSAYASWDQITLVNNRFGTSPGLRLREAEKQIGK